MSSSEVDFILRTAWDTFGQPNAGVVVGGGGSGGSTPTAGTGSGVGGGAGWPTMNNVVQAYINQANTEIAAIQQAMKTETNDLNIAYSAAGAQLTKEQRARFTGIPAVPSPTRNPKMNPFPMSLLSFTDAIQSMSMDTRPHMYAQTLEAITDMTTVGGQSTVAMTRETRNQARLQLVGAELDNNIPGELAPALNRELISNGTIPDVPNGINGYTPPGVLIVDNPSGTEISPGPNGYYDPNTGTYNLTTCVTDVNEVSPIIEILSADATGSAVVRAGARLPCDNGVPIDTGQGYPGSLGGSEFSNLVPDALKWPYNSATITSGSYTVMEAIDEVIKCNCDCWID